MPIRSLTILSLPLAVAAACGGGDDSPTPDAPPDIGFTKPTETLKANVNGVEVGPADLSCLGTPANDPATTVAVTLATTVRDFQNDTTVPNVVVSAFRTAEVDQPFATASADGDGKVSITIPVGVKRFGFKMKDPNPEPFASILDTLLLNQTVDPALMMQTLGSIQTVSKTTAATLPALIGQSRTPGRGVLAGAMRDCQDREMSNFIATVSSTSGTVTHLPGADTYYFDPVNPLPVRHNQRPAASANGLFMVIEIEPAATAYVQVWGYPTAADAVVDELKLVAELQTPVIADTVITGSYEPWRSGP